MNFRKIKSLFIPAAPAVIRARTCDVAYKYRMGAGFAGDVNRTHPFSVEPGQNDPDLPVLFFGQAVVVNKAANTIRRAQPGDTAADIYGIAVRPYPFQQQSGGMSAGFNTGGPGVPAVVDVLRSGYIMVPCNGGDTAAKGGAAFVWTAASAGDNVQGGFEVAADGGNTVQLPYPTTFNGPGDAAGITELAFNI